MRVTSLIEEKQDADGVWRLYARNGVKMRQAAEQFAFNNLADVVSIGHRGRTALVRSIHGGDLTIFAHGEQGTGTGIWSHVRDEED